MFLFFYLNKLNQVLNHSLEVLWRYVALVLFYVLVLHLANQTERKKDQN